MTHYTVLQYTSGIYKSYYQTQIKHNKYVKTRGVVGHSVRTKFFSLYVLYTYLSSIITPFIKIQSVILVFGCIVHREPILLLLIDVFSIILVFGPTKHVSLSNWLDKISASGEILSFSSPKLIFSLLICK